MAKDLGKTPFAFTNILTEPLVEGMPGARQRWGRRTSFVLRFLRRKLRQLTERGGSSPAGSVALAKTEQMWRVAAHAFRSGRVDSAIRYIGSLRRVAEARVAELGDDADHSDVERLARRAWADVKPELRARLAAIEARLAEMDPAHDEDNCYWMETHAVPNSRAWDDEAIALLAAEMREMFHRIIAARANLKFIALHLDDLLWLADWGAPPGEVLTAVPGNRAIRQKLKRIDAHKAYLNRHVSRVLGSSIGAAVRRSLEVKR